METIHNAENEAAHSDAESALLPALIREVGYNISASRWNLVFDICILAACCILFYSNNLFLKECFALDGTHASAFVHNHLNDCLGGAAFLAYCNLLLDLIRPDVRICRLRSCIVFMFFCGLFWEGIAPFFVEGSVGDPLDLLAYLCGSIAYWALQRLTKRAPLRREDEEAPVECTRVETE